MNLGLNDESIVILKNRVYLIRRAIRMALELIFNLILYTIFLLPAIIFVISCGLFYTLSNIYENRIKSKICEPIGTTHVVSHKRPSREILVSIIAPRVIQKVNEIEIKFEKKRPPGIRRYTSVSVGLAGLARRYSAYPWYYEWKVKVGMMMWTRVGAEIIFKKNEKVIKGEDMKIERKNFFTSIFKQAIHQGNYYPEDIKRWLTYLKLDREEIDSLLYELELYRDYLRRHSLLVSDIKKSIDSLR